MLTLLDISMQYIRERNILKNSYVTLSLQSEISSSRKIPLKYSYIMEHQAYKPKPINTFSKSFYSLLA